jgi:hypothetical protein
MSTNPHVSVRLDAETLARVDALGPLFSTRWRPATRSDILRALILSALERAEAEQASEASSRPQKRPRRGGKSGR